MKKLITFCFLVGLSFSVNAQQLIDYYDAVSDGRRGFSYTITVRIQKNSDNNYTATLVQVIPDSKGYYDAYSGKLYTCSQLGNVCQPNNFGRLSIATRYKSNGQEEATGNYSFTRLNETVTLGMRITSGAVDGKPSDASNFKLELMGGTLAVSHTTEIQNKISQLENSTSSRTTSAASSNNSTSTNQSTTTQTTSPIPSLDSQYEKLGIPANTPTYTKSEVTNQIITQASTLAGSLINDWNANYERKMALRDATNKAEIHAAYEKKTEKFKSVYLPLMDLAEKGDENARMILYFASKELGREYLVPQRDEWYQKALANNNTDAQLLKAFYYLLSDKKEDENPVPYMEKLAEKGSVDAMVMLGDWYDISDKSGFKKGGNNPKKAIEWYEKAATKGSPNAMYYLGMIYKYGKAKEISGPLKKWFVEYDVAPDEKKAFDWFTKSLQPDAAQSIYSNGTSYEYFLSEFKPKTYLELAYFYRKGKVVPKDKSKADELEFNLLFAYTNKHKYKYAD